MSKENYQDLINEDQECYAPGYADDLVHSFQRRTIANSAAFFLSDLSPDMTLLDCGCGPGTITAGFAKILTRGKVFGIDIETTQIDQSKLYAQKLGLDNVQFSCANIYEIPFPDNFFDAIFAHAVLQHLKDPVEALNETYRVLKPGGVIGLRDDDTSSLIIAPDDPLVKKLIALMEKVITHHGGNSQIGKYHRQILKNAGFIRTEAFATCEYDGNLENTRWRGDLAAQAAETFVADTAIKKGWVSAEEIKQMAEACRAWGRHPDAFDATIWCEAKGWKA
jgi:ubiquinone/menaquinone biosynthesis C-methylase UbiE